jgi:hypothetical protein
LIVPEVAEKAGCEGENDGSFSRQLRVVEKEAAGDVIALDAATAASDGKFRQSIYRRERVFVSNNIRYLTYLE